MKKRIISAILMIIIFVPILVIGGNVFIVAMGMLGVIALKELLDLKESHSKIPDLVFLIAIINLLLLIFSEFDGYAIAFGLSYRGIALTLLTLLIPCLIYKKDYQTKDALILSSYTIFLGLVFNCVILIRNVNILYLIYLILIATITDIFALVFGKLIGLHKCMPINSISPNKTWEGVIGGTLIGTIIPLIFYNNFVNSLNIKVIIMTIVLSLIGQIGDLVFSKIKRENKIKDYGNIIPGHGGVLDRIDSLIFIILAYIICFGII